MADERTQKISDATHEAADADASKQAEAGRGPTADEAAAAEANTVDPDVAKANKEAIERGASLEGEGRIA